MKNNYQPVMCLKMTQKLTDEIFPTRTESQLFEVGMLVVVEYIAEHGNHILGDVYETVTGRICKISPNPFNKDDYGYLEIDISTQYHSETLSIKTDDIVNIAKK